MLSKSQQQILDTIKSNLENLNRTELPKGGLINVGVILQEFDKAETRMAEIELNNEAFKKLRTELLLQSVDTLNADLKQLGMIARLNNEQAKYSSCIIIEDKQGRSCWTNNLKISVLIENVYEHVGNITNVSVANEISFLFNDTRFTTLKELVEYDNNGGFSKRLFNYYNELNRKIVA